MNYPGPGAYTDAMGSIKTAVLDAVLSGGKVENDSLGMPRARSGAFAYTFKISTRTGNYAFRVFQAKRKGMQARYKAISEEFAARPNAFFVDFEYLTQGIRVDGETYPAIRMHWADGDPLGVYIEKHVKDSQRLRVLQSNIDALALSLETTGIAHGDIQMNNVLVQSNGAVMLVDYDAMFVPGLTNMGSIEVGYPNFQHPKRNLLQPYDATLDRFSFALIHTGLEALIEKPSLWATCHADSDTLLFRAKDLADPANSLLFKQLKALPLTGVFSKRLAALAVAAYQGTPSVSDFLAGLNIPARSSSTSHTSSNIPWWREPVVTHSSGTDTNSGLGEDEVWLIDARVVKDVFDRAGEDVMLVGRINKVDTTVGRLGQANSVQFTLSTEGRDSVFVNVWAEGMKNFAAAGITLDKSWDSRWVTVQGTLSQVLGSPTGQHVILTVTNTADLQLTTYHDARRVLAGRETQQSTAPSATPQTMAARNADLVANLRGSASSARSKATGSSKRGAASSNVPTSSGGTPNQSVWTRSPWPLISVGIFVALLIIGAFLIIDSNGSNSGSSSETPSTQSTLDTFVHSFNSPLSSFKGKCLTFQYEIVSCSDDNARLRVTGTTSSEAGCGVREFVRRQQGYVCTVGMDESIALPVKLETCTEIVYSDGPSQECFPGEQWTYFGCEASQDAVLQQRLSGQWVTVKTNIATEDPDCGSDLPWFVTFTRKSSGIGVKPYQIYVPESEKYFEYTVRITVTVREA